MLCKRCNRKLKNNNSIERGYGGKCYQIHKQSLQIPLITLEDFGL